MTYDRQKVQELSAKLTALHTEEEKIVAELREAFGAAPAPAAETSSDTKGKGKGVKAATAPRKKGAMQELVLKALRGYSTPKTQKDVIARVSKLQGTDARPAAVAAVLSALARAGKISQPTADTYFLPQEVVGGGKEVAPEFTSLDSPAAPAPVSAGLES